MLLETEKDNICINQIIEQKKETITVEDDIIVNDVKPDVLKIISTNGIVSVYKREVMDGKVKIEGSINTYIMYLADGEESKVRSLNTTMDFSKIMIMDNCKDGLKLDDNVDITGFECKILNSRKINVKAFLNIEAKLYSNDTIDYINNVIQDDDIQVLNSQRKICSLVNSGSSKAYAKDNISVPEEDELAEILRADLKIINEDVKISYNKILAKADVKIEIMYLTEDNRINIINSVIPIMGFVDIENIGEDNICDVKYKLRNLIIKPNSDSNSLYIESEFEIIAMAYETKNINLIEDLYGITSDINFETKDVYTMCERNNVKNRFNLSENINIPEIDKGKIYNIYITPKVSKQTIRNSSLIYEGEARLEIIYSINSDIEKKEIDIPFNFETPIDNFNDNMQIDTNINVINDNFIINNSDIEIKIELEFSSNLSNNQKLNIINQISTEEHRQQNIYSMIIYFVKPGDTLWKIAKKFKSTVDDIAKINGIEDANKIYPNQQLYIPKYIKRNVAV